MDRPRVIRFASWRACRVLCTRMLKRMWFGSKTLVSNSSMTRVGVCYWTLPLFQPISTVPFSPTVASMLTTDPDWHNESIDLEVCRTVSMLPWLVPIEVHTNLHGCPAERSHPQRLLYCDVQFDDLGLYLIYYNLNLAGLNQQNCMLVDLDSRIRYLDYHVWQ